MNPITIQITLITRENATLVRKSAMIFVLILDDVTTMPIEINMQDSLFSLVRQLLPVLKYPTNVGLVLSTIINNI